MAHIVGTPGNDLLDGGADRDLIEGLGGNDKLVSGLGGPDTLDGGEGDDFATISYPYGGTDDLDEDFSGLPGEKTLRDGTVLRGIEAVFFQGGSGNDRITGGPGNDILAGRGGDDTVFGGGGDDTLSACSAKGRSTSTAGRARATSSCSTISTRRGPYIST